MVNPCLQRARCIAPAFAHPSRRSAATISSSASRSPRQNVCLFNSWPLCLQLAHVRGRTSLCPTVDYFTSNLRIYATGRVSVQQLTSTPASLGPDGIFICSSMAFAYAGTLRTSVGGGTVTQNRAAVNTRTASNSPQVAANNDDDLSGKTELP
jgi:hypothetical protein